MQIKNVIVGAGIAGCVLARRIAEEKNEKVFNRAERSYRGILL